ncbi:MAG: tetratricopeptide repeat protein [Bacteroidia bacterium]
MVVEDFTMVLQLNPANDAAYYNRGYARIEIGDYPGAVQDFTSAP